MAQFKAFSSILQKQNNDDIENFLLKFPNIDPTVQLANKLDLQRILEFLNTTNDIDIQVKLFSTLSAHLISNNSEIDVIITSNAIYTKLQNVLANGLPRKATEALNFLSALLYLGDEASALKMRTLASYARNMTRVSGCLAIMSDMFTNCMMYHDTWKALCQCLAVVCTGSKVNQSYCTHLIPVCIKKCNQSNIDIFLVLQSLLYGHDRNIQLFLDTDGTNIFTRSFLRRELLHYDNCMQLLATVAQSSTPAAIQIASKTNVLKHLRDFLRLYGPQSQIGQKATIILNHIDSHVEGSCKNATTIESANVHKTFSNDDRDQQLYVDNTTCLMQNVMSEILNLNQNKDVRYIKKSVSAKSTKPHNDKTLIAENPIKERRHSKDRREKFSASHKGRKNKILHSDLSKELSFSFLQNQNFSGFGNNHMSGQRYLKKNNSNSNSILKNYNNNERRPVNMRNNVTITTHVGHHINTTETYKNVAINLEEDAQNMTDLKEFQPVFASTPKNSNKNENTMWSSHPHFCKDSYMASRKYYKRQKINSHRIHKLKCNQEQQTMEIKPRSISTRLFEAINDSCITFVNTVKNIFNPKKNDTQISKEASRLSQLWNFENPASCSYSFTNYMRKRDAVLSKQWTKKENIDCEDFGIDIVSCKTCNDTLVLKRKLSNDDHLKQTVKKLKLGINLYGCDFKKISKTMWPRENYMTPLVLYNLYRKLIAK